MVIGIVGYGLIGRERVAALDQLRQQGLPITRGFVLDPQIEPGARPALPADFAWLNSSDELLAQAPDWIIVATPHDVAPRLVPGYLAAGARVLMEKPMGRNLVEARRLLASQPAPGRLFMGFNYRFFAGINALLADVRAGTFGPLVSMSMVLGHGGAPGMEKGWKFDPEKAGGGCLIDPGIHLLDLCRLLTPGEIEPIGGASWRGFWGTGIEEEAHLVLRRDSVCINVQVSVVRWHSQCRIEVNGTEGYGVVTGRGRSYGPQRYVRGRRWGWQAARSQAESEELVSESPATDSFSSELRALLTGQALNGVAPCTAEEGFAVMELHARCLEALPPRPRPA